MSAARMIIWGIPTLIFAAFVLWYTDFGGPLSETEIKDFVSKLEEQGIPQEFQSQLRDFMETDTGRQFFMLNVLDMTENPPDVEGAEPGESAQQLMSRYMEHMYRELFRRACHPTTFGNAVHTALDLVGLENIDGIDRWDSAAFMRYRSRRSFMEVVTIGETHSRHEFKIAALEKTIAYPVEAQINLGDPRLILGLLLLSLAASTHLVFLRRP